MKLKNISGKEINVNGKVRQNEEQWEEDKSNEIKTLILHNYLREIPK